MKRESRRENVAPDLFRPAPARRTRARMSRHLTRDQFETLVDHDADVQDFTDDLERQSARPDWLRHWVN